MDPVRSLLEPKKRVTIFVDRKEGRKEENGNTFFI